MMMDPLVEALMLELLLDGQWSCQVKRGGAGGIIDGSASGILSRYGYENGQCAVAIIRLCLIRL
ncbi:MAG: hypothetical protein ACKPKO_61420, partial [Candidatus Fonsibacter sp.]